MTVFSRQLHYAPLSLGTPAETASALLAKKGVALPENNPAQLLPLQFAGGQSALQSFWSRLLMAGAVILPFSAAAQAQQPPTANPPSGQIQTAVRTAQPGDIDEVKHPFIGSVADLPQLNRDLKQHIVDLVNNPLLSPGARQDLTQMLHAFNRTPGGQMAIVVIPDTHRNELNTLTLEIFNQMGIGETGKNDGVLLLLNAAAIREGRSTNRMHLMGGTGIDSKFNEEKAMELLQQYALPHLKEKNYDEAVRSTVRGINEFLKPGGSLTPQGTQLSPAQKAGIAALAILGLLLVLAITADLTVNRGQFDLTFMYFELLFRIVQVVAMIATAGQSGGGSSSRGGGVGGGRGGGL